MGYECRLIHVIVLASGIGASAVACSKPERQPLLAAAERTRARLQRAEDKRAISPEGDLIPSDVKLGGIVMPRGYEPMFVEKHAWTYDADIPLDKARRYFEQRLETKEVAEKPLGEVVFRGAREKSDPNMQAVLVKVMPLPSRPTGSRIHIIEPTPASERPPIERSEEVLRLRLAEQQRTAR